MHLHVLFLVVQIIQIIHMVGWVTSEPSLKKIHIHITPHKYSTVVHNKHLLTYLQKIQTESLEEIQRRGVVWEQLPKGYNTATAARGMIFYFLIYLRHMDKQVLNPAKTKAASNM